MSILTLLLVSDASMFGDNVSGDGEHSEIVLANAGFAMHAFSWGRYA